MKMMNSLLAMILVVLELPIMLLTWVIVVCRGTRPVLVRAGTFSDPQTNYLHFNFEGNHCLDRHARRLCFDLGPVLFDVVIGRYSLAEACRVIHLVAQDRRHDMSLPGFLDRFRLFALFGVASVMLWIAWNGF